MWLICFLCPDKESAKGLRGLLVGWLIFRGRYCCTPWALISAPTDVIDTCADVPPFHLLVKKLTYRAATQMVTFPQSHPLEKHVAWAVNKYVKLH